MPLLLLAPFVAGFFGFDYFEDLLDEAADDIGTVLLYIAGFVLLFILVWGSMAYALTSAGFFKQAGKAASGVLGQVARIIEEPVKLIGKVLPW